VIVIPEANKILVLSNGIWKGLKEKIFVGGQVDPISKVGVRLL
jgi:hypothetical protein